jgi:hypothetical protein
MLWNPLVRTSEGIPLPRDVDFYVSYLPSSKFEALHTAAYRGSFRGRDLVVFGNLHGVSLGPSFAPLEVVLFIRKNYQRRFDTESK